MDSVEPHHHSKHMDSQKLPLGLQAAGFEEMLLPSGRAVRVLRVRAEFRAWSAPISIHTWGGKPVLDVAGEQTFAEVAILRLFEAAGWQARWLEAYAAGRDWPIVLRSWHPDGIMACERSTIPDPRVEGTLKSILERNGSSKGCWDVVAWNSPHLVFAESKRLKKDSMKDTQRRWLESALDAGVPLSSFLVVEWTFAPGAEPTKRTASPPPTSRSSKPPVLPRPPLHSHPSGSNSSAHARSHSHSANDVQLFTSKADWIRWYEAHPDGYFYNEKSGGKLHRVGCPHYKLDHGIEEYFKSPKPCHEELEVLATWTERRLGARAESCKSCFPTRAITKRR